MAFCEPLKLLGALEDVDDSDFAVIGRSHHVHLHGRGRESGTEVREYLVVVLPWKRSSFGGVNTMQMAILRFSLVVLAAAPDGALTWFPLGALPGSEAGRYLLEEHSIAIVPIPQRLPSWQACLHSLERTKAPQAAPLSGEVKKGTPQSKR